MTPIILAAALCQTVTVWDGDTMRCDGEKVRIANIDAPELPGSSRPDPREVRAIRLEAVCLAVLMVLAVVGWLS